MNDTSRSFFESQEWKVESGLMKKTIFWCLAATLLCERSFAQTLLRDGGPPRDDGRGVPSTSENFLGLDSFLKKIMVLDIDGDGSISNPEMTDIRLQFFFKRTDTNNDGTVTKSELEALHAKEGMSLANGGRGGPPRRPDGGPGGPFGLGGGPNRGPARPSAGPDQTDGPREEPPRGGPGGRIEQSPIDRHKDGMPTPEKPNAQSGRVSGGLTRDTSSIVQSQADASQDWTAWRGGNGTNVLEQGSLPIRWNSDENIRWKVNIAGYGWSSPVLVGNRVFITTARSEHQKAPGRYGPGSGNFEPPGELYRWEVHCYDARTGKLIWNQVVAEKEPKFGIHPSNTYATETPVSDGYSLFVRFGEIGLICFDMDGSIRWKRELGPYPMQGNWGTSSNPVLIDNALLIQSDHEWDSSVAAYEKETGKLLWRSSRSEKSAWSTPYVWKNRWRTEVVLIGAKSIQSYNPDDGTVLWSLGATGQSRTAEGDNPAMVAGSCKASPVGDADVLYVGKGNRAKAGSSQFGPLWAVSAGGKGDINLSSQQGKSDQIAWYREDAGPVIASPLLYQGLLYLVPRNGSTIHCLDAKTGENVYSKTLGRESGFFVTPWAANGYVYVPAMGGTTYVLRAGREFELVSTNEIQGHTFAVPALSDGRIFFRTAQSLFCISDRMEEKIAVRGTVKNDSSINRRLTAAYALEELTQEQLEQIGGLADSTNKELELNSSAGAAKAGSRSSERIRDNFTRRLEALLKEKQKKALRTELAKGSGDPGAANGGPITTLREQLSKIGLTDEQDFAVQSLVLQLRDDIGLVAHSNDSSNRGESIRTISEEYKAKITEVLTDEQRQRLRELQSSAPRRAPPSRERP